MNQPNGLALDGGGNLYVAYTGGDTNYIEKFDATGKGAFFASLGTPFQAAGMAIDNHSNLYVASWTGGTVEKFSPAGLDLGRFGNLTVQTADALAFDSQGNLYLSDGGGTQIVKFTPDGQGTVFLSGNDYRGLAFDHNDKLYVGVGWSIEEYSTNGTSLGTLALRPGEFAGEGLMFDDNGNLVFTDYLHGTLCRISPQGTETTVATMAGSSDLWWIAIQPTAPRLGLALTTGNKIVLNWPATTPTNYALQCTTNLAIATSWTNCAGSPVLSSNLFLVTNSINGENMFYRLRQP